MQICHICTPQPEEKPLNITSTYFQKVAGNGGTWQHWQEVKYVDAKAATRSLRAGDILVKDGADSRHVMIAMGRPTESEKRDGKTTWR